MILKNVYILLVIVIFPILAFSETIFLKDRTNINTNVYWEENKDLIGYFLDGKSKYIKKDLIDWNKTKERHSLINNKKNIPKNYIVDKNILDSKRIFEDMKMYLKSIDILDKYGNPETLSETNNDRWVVYFPKGNFTIITDKKSNRIIRIISGRGFQ
ncbi:hypothetical protein DSCO28_36880 [Desulfosarcina ovata subsp. sediminis]|uniref:Uncharacterized protein n=1 Tax=Desulfosarcina ovata subsp. sediminis TaxID=885957 RepID=A0A5K7ZSE0_9BACT|nr:hypothetical protein [Desulfosarcina ovata]BBO83122.1 hypothetical protein DSCO28_36880 [Desulfosarcina ovata subsp. sediminis]